MKKTRAATIKDIARIAGVSPTTVSKALRGMPRVSEPMREKILSIADELHYHTNQSARALRRGRSNVIVITVDDASKYVAYFDKGLDDALREMPGCSIHLEHWYLDNIFDIDRLKQYLDKLLEIDVDGVIFCAITQEKEYEDRVRRIMEKGIPLIFVTQGMEHVEGNGSIVSNRYVIGKMAAQLFNLCLEKNSQVAVIASNKDFKAHITTLRGFYALTDPAVVSDISTYESQDSAEIAYFVTEKFLKEHPKAAGIFVTSYMTSPVIQCVKDRGKSGEIAVIGQDFYPEIAQQIRSGSLLATIYQNQYEMGRLAIKQMVLHLGKEQPAERNILLMPQLIMASNLECYHSFENI